MLIMRKSVGRVGNLEADFQQVPLVHFFSKVSTYCCETSIIQILQRKLKKIFSKTKIQKKKKKKKKNHFTIESQANVWS